MSGNWIRSNPSPNFKLIVSTNMDKSTFLKVEIFDEKLTLRVIDDDETFDFVEDTLVEEHDLEHEFDSRENPDHSGHHRLYYPRNTSRTNLLSAVDAIELSELEQIWRLNN